jgi:hypothetical protein
VAEAIGMTYSDFAVVIRYADASYRPRETVRLDIANGPHPYMRDRSWDPASRGEPKATSQLAAK